ncbi:hypothetical protein BLA29_001265 [Euroglyphus maynei]|uniref:Uncharacterized protein n=1 Tax=Euroglyphus maynei TaxID=6958 RepID=A0A1Y3AYX9_EURMA|nr:hypothetical protein BLA29_001265 [Euroglyphus maynei]
MYQQQQYGTPQGGYPGQYPSSGVPPQYNPEAGYGDQFEGFGSKAVRLGFIRKVYGILSVQLTITFGFVLAIATNESASRWTRENSWLMFVAL